MNEYPFDLNEENDAAGGYERSGVVIETVELSIVPPKAGTILSCKDPSGFDQTPIPEVSCGEDCCSITALNVNGVERPSVFYRTYSTLVFYDDVKVEEGQIYTVFGKVIAKPGYIFNEPVDLIINGEEVSPELLEDYSLEGDSFVFYFDIEAMK